MYTQWGYNSFPDELNTHYNNNEVQAMQRVYLNNCGFSPAKKEDFSDLNERGWKYSIGKVMNTQTSTISGTVATAQNEQMLPIQGDAHPTSSGIEMSPEPPDEQRLPAQNEAGEHFDGRPLPNARLTEPVTPIVKFRYCSENRAEPIHGIRSTTNQKTWPTIQISYYDGPAFAVAYCVTADLPYMIHPHKLLLNNNDNGNVSNNGIVVFNKTITEDNNALQLNIKIQCVKWQNVQDAIELRKQARVPQLTDLEINPFGHEFEQYKNKKSLDLNRVRLVFRVFIRKDGAWHSLEPIVSDVISKSPRPSGVPNIKCASQEGGSMSGSTKIFLLLSDMVDHTDLEMIFYEVNAANQVIWNSKATIKEYYEDNKAIVAVTPAYTGCRRFQLYQSPINVWFYLRKPSNIELCSQSLPFKYISDEMPLPAFTPLKSYKGKTKKVRLRRSIPDSEAASATPADEEAQAADSDKALSKSLAHLSIKS